MVSYLQTRIAQAFVTIFSVVSLSFVIIRSMPGGPMDFLKAQLIRSGNVQDEEQLMALMEVYVNLRPDEPLWRQYIDYMVAIFQGDLGRSFVQNEAVGKILAEALPWTLFVMSISIILFFSLGITMGATMAYLEGSRFDMTFSVLAIITNSTPYYVFAVLFVFLFGNLWGVFPPGGRYSLGVTPGLNQEFIVDAIRHAIMPIMSLVIAAWGGAALGMRGNSVSILGEDYLRVGELRGLSTERLAVQYVGRNAILPLYTRFMITIGFMFGGSILLETIFRYQGIGFYMFRAIGTRDYPLMMGGFLVITAAVVVGIFIADVTYGKLDPRISAGDGNGQ